MKILVQKFGGTSVGTAERRNQVVRHIIRAREAGYRPVVVVSAMGRAGDPYATDTLLQLVARGKDGTSPRELDLLMSCGEVIAAIVLVQALREQNMPARAYTGAQAGIVTDNHFGCARIIEVKPERIREAIREEVVPVVAGFQGQTQDGEITTLGRGGSDTTAAALGVALQAELVEIFTDVDGIMTADPRIEPQARILETVTYREIAEMAHLGARIIHPRAVEIAMEGHIPIRIRATGSSSPGTLICDGGSGSVEIKGDKVVTGIAHVGGMAQVKIETTADFNESQLALGIFQTLAQAGISLDMIYVSPHLISFIVESYEVKRVRALLNRFPVEVGIKTELAKVSAVGAGMRGVPGVMARVIRALHRAGVNIYQTTDSHANISCLVRESDLEKAVQALHRQFELGR